MKLILILLGMIGIVFTASAQTNIINISNSKVIIYNYTIINPSGTNIISVIKTNVVANIKEPENKKVIVSRYALERLRWESFLLQRQRACQQAYLRRISRR